MHSRLCQIAKRGSTDWNLNRQHLEMRFIEISTQLLLPLFHSLSDSRIRKQNLNSKTICCFHSSSFGVFIFIQVNFDGKSTINSTAPKLSRTTNQRQAGAVDKVFVKTFFFDEQSWNKNILQCSHVWRILMNCATGIKILKTSFGSGS